MRRREYEKAADALRARFDDRADAALAQILLASASERSGVKGRAASPDLLRNAGRKAMAATHYYAALSSWSGGDLERAHILAGHTIDAGDKEFHAFALELQGWIEISRRRLGAAARRFLETLDALHDGDLRDEHLRSSALQGLSYVALATFDFDLLPRLASELSSLRPTTDTGRATVSTMLRVSTLFALQGEDLASYEMLLAARSVNVPHPFPALVETEIAAHHRRHGNDDARTTHLALAYRSLEATNWTGADIEARLVHAVFAAEAARSRDPRAGAALTKALSFSGKRDPMLAFERDERAAAMMLLARGRVHEARGKTDAAAADVGRAVEIWEGHGDGYLSAVGALDLMRISGNLEITGALRMALRDAPKSWFKVELESFAHRSESPTSSLGPAEMLVLEKICTGATSREISEELGRSLSTIRNQTVSIFRKFGVHTRTELVAKVSARGQRPGR